MKEYHGADPYPLLLSGTPFISLSLSRIDIGVARKEEIMNSEISPEDFYHKANVKATEVVFCYRPFTTTSSGVWLGDNPLEFSFPLLLFQITIIFIITRLTHALLRRLQQPIAISQIIGGMLLGPSLLGRNKTFEELLFSGRSWEQLNTVALLAFILFAFGIGLQTDLNLVRNTGKKAITIAILSTVLPFAAVIVSALTLHPYIPAIATQQLFIFNLALRWCLTSYINLSWVLHELRLLTSKLSRLAMSATLLAGFGYLFLSSILSTYLIGSKLNSPGLGIASFAAFIGFWVFVLLVARPAVMWMVRRNPVGSFLSQTWLVMVLLLALLSALMSETMGYHLMMGPFSLGLVLPGGAPLGVTMTKRLDRLVTGVFLPVFLATAGMRMDLASLADVSEWGLAEIFILICVVTKFISVMLPCLYFKMPMRDALAVSLIMSTRGIFEVDGVNQWQDSKLINRQVYTATMVSIIALGGSTAPLFKYLYRPEDRFVTHKRRTIQHSRLGDELRVISCVHSQENVAPAINLLVASHATPDSPICVYVLHLLQLDGHNAAVLRPYKRHRPGEGPSSASTETDHIVNAFAYLELHQPGRFSVLPYICLSPYATMHNDVCSVALDKKVALVVVPFHRRGINNAGAGIEWSNPAVRSVNMQVLRYAPCSVGILVDHGLPPNSGGHNVGVYFFGGADDREALAYASRMAEDPAVGMTLVRFRAPRDNNGREEERMDEEAVEEFRRGQADGKRVMYREEMVRDGEGTVAVIRSMCGHFTLLVVGRREGRETPLTSGLSAWSEYPELGAIGDLLASTDFAGWVTTLVVQQQARFGDGGGQQADSPRAGNRAANEDEN